MPAAARSNPSDLRAVRFASAVGVVALATLARAAVDPVIHGQIPYFIYIASIVVATRLYGVDAGVLSTVVAAFAGNYFFVAPRYALIPHPDDWIAMGLFSAVSLGLVWLVGRWVGAEREVRRLHHRTNAVLEQMPVAVIVADASATVEFANSMFERVFGGRSLPGTSFASFREATDYDVLRPDGSPMPPPERPLGRALRGETIRDEEIHIVHGDGRRAVLSTSGAPILDDDGRISAAVTASIDITERKRIEAQLLRREEELRAATLAAEVGVWTWTPGTNHVSVGANWRGLFGVDPDTAVTFETWVDAVHPDDRQRVVETLNAAWSERGQFAVEYRVLCPDGTVRWLIDRGRAFRDAGGNVAGMAGINIDITQRRDAEEAQRDANRMKDEFLATLSHELRTPLNAIVGWADMLRRGDLKPEDMKRATESIYRNARVQSELIDDVLDVSRIISGKVRIQAQPVDPAAVLRAALDSVRSAAEAKGVEIATALESPPFPVSGDATRIQQVFWNLLSNAVKFTPPGGEVRVSLRLLHGHVQVEVADNGIGIGAQFLPHVFERFRQEDSSTTRKHAGLGLGLAIVRHLVELHGGTVKAESAGEGKGATFTVMLPAARFEERRRDERVVARQVPPVAPVPEDLPALCGLRVLLVDDERDAREVASSVLRHHGADVATAASGAQALAQFDLFDPHVLLVDLAMPGMDGYALIDRIRVSSGPKGRKVPAIAFTAFAREEDRQRTLATGFQLHLAKPVDSHALVRAVAGVARRPRSAGSD